jgi:hypothetical protein
MNTMATIISLLLKEEPQDPQPATWLYQPVQKV